MVNMFVCVDYEGGMYMRRKICSALTVLTGIATFIVAAYAFKENSGVNAYLACIPAVVCLIFANIGSMQRSKHMNEKNDFQ